MKDSLFNGTGRFRKPHRTKVLRVKKTEDVERLFKKTLYRLQEIEADLRNMQHEAKNKKSYKVSYLEDVMRLIDLLSSGVTDLINKQEEV